MHPGIGGSAGDEPEAACEAVAQKLRELPNEAPPPFDWSELRRRMQRRSAGDRARREVIMWPRETVQYRVLAVIAAVVVIAAALLIANRFERGAGGLGRMRADAGRAQLVQPGARLSESRGSEAEALLARADSAEQWLADRPDDGAVVQVSAHLAIVNLEERIAAMDDLVNVERLQHRHPSRLLALQLQRAQLVDSLAQVRYAEMLVKETP